ncbi:cytochrome P450 [Nocardioides montaniterrae]
MERFRRTSGAIIGRGLPKPALEGLPPGPKWPPLVQTVALMRFRHQFHPWLTKKYGDVFTINLVPGGRPLVMFTDPDVTKEIFAADPAVFHAGKGNAILGPIMGVNSLLIQDAVEHHRARKLVMPAFLGHALRGYQGMVAEVAKDEIDTWRDGAEMRALEHMNSLTLEIILKVVFGVADEEMLAALRPRVTAIVEVNPAILLGWAYPRLQRFGPWKRTVENMVELDRLLYSVIRERRTDPDLETRQDVLSRLLRHGAEAGDGLDDTELRDQLITLLLAGHETTASALSWTLIEIGKSPALRERAARAAAEGDDAWLEAALKEAMRLRPIIPMVVRTLMEPTTVGGIDLPAGATVGPSIIMSHQKSSNFPDPEEFRPDRFLGSDVPALNVWIPFGGGVRRCIGAGFSLMEGVEILREIFGRYDVETLRPDVAKVRNITSVPRHGAQIRVTQR